jgi:hypothetical protein
MSLCLQHSPPQSTLSSLSPRIDTFSTVRKLINDAVVRASARTVYIDTAAATHLLINPTLNQHLLNYHTLNQERPESPVGPLRLDGDALASSSDKDAKEGCWPWWTMEMHRAPAPSGACLRPDSRSSHSSHTPASPRSLDRADAGLAVRAVAVRRAGHAMPRLTWMAATAPPSPPRPPQSDPAVQCSVCPPACQGLLKAHVAMVCFKCSIVPEVCCKCFRWMLQK